MIKKIILIAGLFLSVVALAQQGTSSPYSFYGIGEVRFKGAVENRSMAGLSIAPDSIHINLQNPAAFSDLKLTSFSVGGTFASTNQKTNSQSGKTNRTGLDYMAVGLPLGKLGIGFGLIPYSSVGYKIQNFHEDNTQLKNRYYGEGGLNKVFAGFGYKISPKLSIGADVQYNFGKIETSNAQFTQDISVGTQDLNVADLSGVNFNFGAMFQTKITKKLDLYSSLSFSPENILKSQNSREIANVIVNSLFEITTTSQPLTFSESENLRFSKKFSFGTGIGESKKWLIGAEVVLQDENSLNNGYNTNSSVTFGKYAKYSLGGYYIPNYKSFTSFAKRITYRAGIKYEETGLIINSESINDMGLTLGLGIPLRGTFSNINIGFELGKKGTTAANLIQENYANISVGFSLNDKWFEKRKFN
jgi:long-subunit fatty acid transport protein